MSHKKFNAATHRPTGKQNCICWLDTGEKVTSFYHQKRRCFIGRYNSWRDKELLNVVKWSYAILPKRHSHLLDDMVEQLGLTDGTEVFRTQYSVLELEKQERLFEEVQLVKAAILNWLNRYS